nr:MAG TPA: restriction alleviation protein [Caudoviricetes sp.]
MCRRKLRQGDDNLERLKPCPFCGCGDRRVGIRRMGNNGYRICCSKCGSLGPHVSVKEWNGQKELAQKEAREKWNERARKDG